jgi:hypothetical protein
LGRVFLSEIKLLFQGFQLVLMLLLLLLSFFKFKYLGGKFQRDFLGSLLKLSLLGLVVGHDLVHFVETLL